jgi:hypothetical protein
MQYVYPSLEGRSDEDRINEAINYFNDDKSTPNQDILDKIKASVAQVNAQIEQMQTAVDANNQPVYKEIKVVSVVTNAWSSTSWVNSGYQGIATSKMLSNVTVGAGNVVMGKAKDASGNLVAVQVGKEMPQAADKNTKRNVPLAADRCKNLLSYLKTQLQTGKVGTMLTSTGGTYIEEKPLELPNNGPMWQKVGGQNLFTKEQMSISSYGPLFQQAYGIDKNLTPRGFYGARNDAAAQIASSKLGKAVTAADLKAEYESIYKNYRQSGCKFTVIIEATPSEIPQAAEITEKEYVVSTVGSFEISLLWSTGADRFFDRLKGKLQDIDWKKIDLSFLKPDSNDYGPLSLKAGTACFY